MYRISWIHTAGGMYLEHQCIPTNPRTVVLGKNIALETLNDGGASFNLEGTGVLGLHSGYMKV